jgi:hypothetical protein
MTLSEECDISPGAGDHRFKLCLLNLGRGELIKCLWKSSRNASHSVAVMMSCGNAQSKARGRMTTRHQRVIAEIQSESLTAVCHLDSVLLWRIRDQLAFSAPHHFDDFLPI